MTVINSFSSYLIHRITPHISRYYSAEINAAPLAIFRIIFGLIMAASVVRFASLGWIHDQYIAPKFHFTYYGFEWISPLPAAGMYAVFAVMFLAALGIAFGLLYRVSAMMFFLTFTYVELLDKTYYLNHYYFVSIVAFLLILLPAHSELSFDVLRKPFLQKKFIPRWCIDVLKFQVGLVYCYAGLAKINPDWLIGAMPLKLWLPANDNLPVIGWMLKYEATAFIASWCGMLFDCLAPFALMWRRTRNVAYAAVVVFHTVTGALFQIGVFPVVMIGATWIFFSTEFHIRVVEKIRYFSKKYLSFILRIFEHSTTPSGVVNKYNLHFGKLIFLLLVLHCVIQLLIPWRFLFYPGALFWTEEGYRFSWRVMLMEKAGTATFYIKDSRTEREGVVANSEFLNPTQEKQMAMQPDMILQYAHYLHTYYSTTVYHPQVRAEVYVTLNGRPSRLLIDPHVDLSAEIEGFTPKSWILR